MAVTARDDRVGGDRLDARDGGLTAGGRNRSLRGLGSRTRAQHVTSFIGA